jgi:phospholipase D1/2
MAEHPRRSTIFEPGRNCWRVENAARAAFMVDADDYFRAFVQAARQAQRTLTIVGWDFHSRTRLLKADGARGALELGPFLNELARARRALKIRILIWDYPMVFGLDREWGPLYGLGWKPHRRIAFRYDNTHPIGGSHHQKVVVVDDVLAFNGGIDLTSRRWDTCRHAPDDEHRMMGTVAYPPFHDVMMAVQGAAARALGELTRERWRRATGELPEPPRARRRIFRRRGAAPMAAVEPWPDSLRADVSEVPVALSRTEPPGNGGRGLKEVEALYLDMIAAARRCIYIENQYFTAERIGEALASRLAEPHGPELVVVLRELSHGWLEELTMQTLRTRLIEKLRAADRYGRLSVYYPYIAGLKSGTCIDVHSKLMIVDDDLLRIGSANLANRSLGLDTECDLTIEAREREDVRTAIRDFRARLVAEHLGCESAQLREATDRAGSLRAAIEQLQREDRTLKPLIMLPQVSDTMMNVISVADPEKPVALGDLVKLLGADMGESTPARHGPAWGKIAATAAALIVMAAAWKLTPLQDVVTGERIVRWARDFGDEWWAPLLAIAAYTPASVTLFPRPLITLFAVIAFGPVLGFIYAMLGIELAAWSSFMVGRRLERRTVRRLAGVKLHDILLVLRRRGLVAMTALRLVPLAPFAVEGVVAGAVRVKVSDFLLGTAIGMLPGTLTSTVFGDQLQVWLEDPSRINYWLIGLVLMVLVVASLLVRRWLMVSAPSDSSDHDVRGARAV